MSPIILFQEIKSIDMKYLEEKTTATVKCSHVRYDYMNVLIGR
jgi:hypothetical protein